MKRRANNNWEARNGKSRRVAQKTASCGTPPVAVVTPKPFCSVCKTVESPKYKCPKCRESYCSIQCCRDHKEKGCHSSENDRRKDETTTNSTVETTLTSKYLPREEIASRGEVSFPKPISERERDDEDLEEGWKMTDAMETAMQQSDWLRNELKDGGLRHIICGILSAPDTVRRNQTTTKQEAELDQSKEDYPLFRGFVDKLLVLTGVLDRHGSRMEEPELVEWLNNNSNETDSSGLILNPINQPARKIPGNVDADGNDDSVEEPTESSSDGSDSED